MTISKSPLLRSHRQNLSMSIIIEDESKIYYSNNPAPDTSRQRPSSSTGALSGPPIKRSESHRFSEKMPLDYHNSLNGHPVYHSSRLAKSLTV
ncbi:hypothetical protein KIN20_002330 [Parelaphostrongylus tenuis]|uniref:Uncharacterized protein n=1 Tax=Parelaphostrongylus tenuis TaxID=148309 RepID=A0AAD5ME17_PARTN|nr:hypothetical protein KIN20_002330 [Parelaphostrongylus tenuis]